MPTPTKGPRLGGGPAHERLMLANLATQLFQHRSITTTETKAKRMAPLAERMITFAKRGDLAARRRVLTTITDKSVVHELFTEIAPAMAERQGGYTRITKVGNRKGDNAPMAVIELVLEPLTAAQATVREAEAATKRSAKAPVAEAAAPVENPDSAAPLADGSAPEGFTIKGNADSNKYHGPDSQWYDQTVAEVWFRTEEAAEAAGFTKAGATDEDDEKA
ncbi:MAG TPA: 50S ribosomal protein L17 [Kineosporiaceae bacterium]|nr:50S ribosomal protein L17 [Kineosporiaceae bacterium]